MKRFSSALRWGSRPWGRGKAIGSDPEWKYVSVRRYLVYLEHSIDRSTQWAVFEPNGEELWANVRRTIDEFLFSEWQKGKLLGDKQENAYFVKCDRSTMTQDDLDNGRLVCLIGVAVLRPAEFVIFRIGHWTSVRPRSKLLKCIGSHVERLSLSDSVLFWRTNRMRR